ncbi:MAG: hypothetical protein FJX20_22965 [Alphaproteobacteria bacterium]|nr:hypothetical protein [Alphaproteobacteria bacterium]
MTARAESPAIVPVSGGRLGALAATLAAVALALTPITAVLTLGWLVRLARREAMIALLSQGWALRRRQAIADLARAPDTEIAFPGFLRGLWRAFTAGVFATVGITMLMLPASALLALSWWAGWENSFNKGYEQAWVGPALGLAGTLIAAATLLHAPMLTAHAAVERRLAAFLEFGVARRLIGAVRWRYLALGVASVVAALPPLAIQAGFAFMANATDDATAREAGTRLHGFATVYLVLVVTVLRLWAARLYARAVLAIWPAGRLRDLAPALGIAPSSRPAPPPKRRLAALVTGVVGFAVWVAFILALYVAQFANHAWWNWFSQPIVGLPWVFRVL